MIVYLTIGLGVYLAASAAHSSSFKDASFISIVKGILFGLLLWPIGLVVLYYAGKNDLRG